MRIQHFAGASFFLVAVLASRPANGCGFIDSVADAVTLRQKLNAAKFVAYGTFANPQKHADGSGSTDFVISSVIKPYPSFDKKNVRLPRYVAVEDAQKPPSFLVFFDAKKGKIEATGADLVGPAVIDYIKGLQAVGASDRTRLLRYCFDFLEHPDRELAADALLEFMKTTDVELGAAGRTLPAKKLRAWIRDPTTSAARLRMYGFLLGNCGNDADADLLRSVLAKRVALSDPGLFDGVLTGYVLLRPKEGWTYVRHLMGNPANLFTVRYSALRAVRFFFNGGSDVIGKATVLDVLGIALLQPDMADFPIEYLRQRQCWELTDRVLALYGKTPFDTGVVRRAILRYALQCPRPVAAAFVARMRQTDAELVNDTAESFKENAGR